MSNKIYPIGIQNFEKIRKGGYCYIDCLDISNGENWQLLFS